MAFLGWFTKSDWSNICLKIYNKIVNQIALGGLFGREVWCPRVLYACGGLPFALSLKQPRRVA